MASRSSAHYSTENYVGTRRGRSAYGEMDFSLFPEKYEVTDIIEDPDQLNEMWRDTLKDRTPDNGHLFAHEEPRRNTLSRDFINLRDGGARVNTDPYMNEDYDLQFRDKDPRGWSNEQPWKEYRRHLENQLKMIDFKDDGDYSTTSGHIHPNTLYKSIRGSQNWLKARLKIFETSLENKHVGGTGVYDNISNVFKNEFEDTSVMIDGSIIPMEDPVNRARLTTMLSNWVHGGSKALRSNTTTDHKVKVAAYGKLLSQRGLISHENQLRLTEEDTKRSIIEGIYNQSTNNLVRLMSNAVNGSTAAASNRYNKQSSGDAPNESERFRGMKYDESITDNRNNILTRDIMSLLGITDSEVKFLESTESNNNKQAQVTLANLYKMAEVVHRLPANIKLQVRDELLLKAAGGGLTPSSDTQLNRESVVVNPKIIQFMDLSVKKSKDLDTAPSLLELGIVDSEGKLNTWVSNTPLLNGKTASKNSENLMGNRYKININHEKPDSRKINSYKTLKIGNTSYMDNRDHSILDRIINSVDNGIFTPGKNLSYNQDIRENFEMTEVDNEFGENKSFTKHGGMLGNKRSIMDQTHHDRVYGYEEITRGTPKMKW